jgi:homoserine dehydrogenase
MKTISIAIFGLGVVGSHVVKLLEKNSYKLNNTKYKIVGIGAKNKNKKRNFDIKKYNWIKNYQDLSKNQKPDLIIETIGGTGSYINSLYNYCIDNNISLITANKAQLAENGHSFFGKFDKKNLFLGFEAAVLGAVPVVRSIEQSILPSKVKGIYGIFNGTTNYIISQMYENKISFQDSLNQAIKNGFAEQDSSADLSGRDATHKLVLLSNLSFGHKFKFSDLNFDGIENIKLIDLEQGLKLGYKLKLVSISEQNKNKFYSSVAPCFVPENSLVANTNFEENVISLEGDDFLKTSLVGKGAGGYPTATSIISDLKKFALHQPEYGVFQIKYSNMPNASFYDPSLRKRPYYIRMSVLNKVGVLKSIANLFAQQSISIKSLIQLNTSNDKVVPIIIISDATDVSKINHVVKNLKKSPFLKKEISVIRIEEKIG